MPPFLVFIIILVVIWTLSGIATWVNKQKEAERRRMVREQLSRVPGALPPAPMPQRPRPMKTPPRRAINPELARRFPDVLLPPAPTPTRAAKQRKAPRMQAPQRAVPQQAQRAPEAEVLNDEGPHSSILTAAPSPQPPAAPPVQAARTTIDANALSRWLKPATLRRQFLLTEILQPPVALRPPRF